MEYLSAHELCHRSTEPIVAVEIAVVAYRIYGWGLYRTMGGGGRKNVLHKW